MTFLSTASSKKTGFTRTPKNLVSGFTLIELLVVIAIIGILASIISVSLVSARAKSRDGKRVADIRTIQLSLEEYYNDNGYYPISDASLAPTYIPALPTDPNSPTGAPIQYKYSSYNISAGNPTGTGNCLGKANYYHLAAAMESDNTNNSVLNQDVDWAQTSWTACTGATATFHGNAAACVGTVAGANDTCYDVTN